MNSWGGSNSDFYYNLFYTIYAWTNMAMSLVAGVMVDRLGKTRSMYAFISLCLVGSSLFALGATLVSLDDRLRYAIMFVGRFVFGLGGGSITIVQNAISAQWFKGKELAMAFGCTLTISRIGSVVNFLLTPGLYSRFEAAAGNLALGITLWVGAALVFISISAAWAFDRLDKRAEAAGAGPYRALDGAAAPKSRKINFADVKSFPASYWLICLTITFFYNLIFPFMADAVTVFSERFGEISACVYSEVTLRGFSQM